MRLINDSGPVPSRTGRNIGSLACDDGISTCDQLRSTIDSRITAITPKTRMARYAIATAGIFNRNFEKLRRRRRPTVRPNPMHDLMAPEVIDHGVARLHRMKDTSGGRSFEQSAQLHEAMAAAARIESVKSDDVAYFALKRLTIR